MAIARLILPKRTDGEVVEQAHKEDERRGLDLSSRQVTLDYMDRLRTQAPNAPLKPQTGFALAFVLVLSMCQFAAGQVPQVPRGDWIQEQRKRALQQQQLQQRLRSQRAEEIRAKAKRDVEEQQRAMVAAQRAQAVALQRERQDLTNQVYLRYPRPISPENRIVGSNLCDSASLKSVYSQVGSRGSDPQIQIRAIGKTSVTCAVTTREFRQNVDQALYAGGSSQEILFKEVSIFNYPISKKTVTGAALPLTIKAMRVANWRPTTADGNETDVLLQAFDCGLPDTIENRENAGIPVPTPGQIAAAQEEIAAGLREIDEEKLASQKQAAETAAANHRQRSRSHQSAGRIASGISGCLHRKTERRAQRSGWKESVEMRNPPENLSVPTSMQSATTFAEANGSDAAWKTLALRLAEEGQTCLDNAHWEVKFGSGDMLKTIKAIRLMAKVEAAEQLNKLRTTLHL